MKNDILKVISDTLNINIETLSEDMGPGDTPEWDSLGHQNLILALESKFKIKLDIDEVLEMETIEDIVDTIKEKLKI